MSNVTLRKRWFVERITFLIHNCIKGKLTAFFLVKRQGVRICCRATRRDLHSHWNDLASALQRCPAAVTDAQSLATMRHGGRPASDPCATKGEDVLLLARELRRLPCLGAERLGAFRPVPQINCDVFAQKSLPKWGFKRGNSHARRGIFTELALPASFRRRIIRPPGDYSS